VYNFFFSLFFRSLEAQPACREIPNTLIALETGVLTDENSLIKWDSTHHGVETWNRDHTLQSIDILKKIMVLEKTDKYTLSAKTGMALRTATRIGWLVGFLERDGNVYFFATNTVKHGETVPPCGSTALRQYRSRGIEQKDAGDLFGKARLEITRKIFQKLRLM
jgi:beta-lactamase class D